MLRIEMLRTIIQVLLAIALVVLIGTLIAGVVIGRNVAEVLTAPRTVENTGNNDSYAPNNDGSVGTDPQTRRVDISCVQRANFGEKVGFGTVTWDNETRVWVLEDFTCEGPYCFTYDACRDPEAAIELQPFFLGYELSPVTGKKFEICHDFEGDCAR